MKQGSTHHPPPQPPAGWKNHRHMKAASKRQSLAAAAPAALPPTRAVALLSALLLFLAGAVSIPWINYSLMISATTSGLVGITATSNAPTSSPKPAGPKPTPPPESPLPAPTAFVPFSCPTENQTKAHTCGKLPSAPTPDNGLLPPPSTSCPDYFRWMHEDLRPWSRTGITREMVERAGRTANFRLVVVGGRAFVERFRPSFQSRDVFTLWGIVQLLRRYPGRLPDLELMFDTVDWPVVKAADFGGRNASAPPPLFRYCGDDSTLDIVFPDWSFWGWPEINIKPWEKLKLELKEANNRLSWMQREPLAYWKGNPAVAATRLDLIRCNLSQSRDWNARLYAQDWLSQTQKGFQDSNLATQCTHRYKIYIEGSAWSVSNKYILACDSMALVIKPRFYDFFTRGLMPVHHYWPIRDDHKCTSIKFAVDWGNSHKRKSQAIGKEASDFIQEKLKMDFIYDYMFHLLSQYAKLLKFRPRKPRGAVGLCAESMACSAHGQTQQFMMESMVKAPHGSPPCSLAPPYSPVELKVTVRRKANSIKQVEIWEQKASNTH